MSGVDTKQLQIQAVAAQPGVNRAVGTALPERVSRGR